MYKVLVFGTGSGATKLKGRVKNEINILAYIDNDKSKVGNYIEGKMIISPDEIINYSYDYIIIASDFYEEIWAQLINLNVDKNQIIEFFNSSDSLINNIPLEILIKKDLFVRNLLSKIYLQGCGIEIGALHNPLWKAEDVSVKYVDRMSVDKLRIQYPELRNHNLVPVDIIDDGEKLKKVDDESLDFIICNHMLEHCENPIGVIRNFLKKLRLGGIIYCTVPDKRFTFDRKRELTCFKHLIKDDLDLGQSSKYNHFYEVVKNGNELLDDLEIEKRVNELMEASYSIHYHVWDSNSFFRFVSDLNCYLSYPFEVKHLQSNGDEIIVIISRIL